MEQKESLVEFVAEWLCQADYHIRLSAMAKMVREDYSDKARSLLSALQDREVRMLADHQPWIGGVLDLKGKDADGSNQQVTVLGSGFARVRNLLPEKKDKHGD